MKCYASCGFESNDKNNFQFHQIHGPDDEYHPVCLSCVEATGLSKGK